MANSAWRSHASAVDVDFSPRPARRCRRPSRSSVALHYHLVAMQSAPRTVLIVATSPDDRAAIARLLAPPRGRGYRVLEAASASDALTMVHAAVPACLLLHHHPPEMDGLAVLDRL